MSTLNLVKPQGAKIAFNKKEYDIVFDFNAFAKLEQDFGSIEEAFSKLNSKPKASDILKIVLAGMESNSEIPTEKELGKFLTPQSLPQVIEVLTEAINNAMPKTEETAAAKN